MSWKCQAQLALRQMKKEQDREVEDPDKLFAEEDDDGSPVKKNKGKGKGRGRGRGKGPKAKAKHEASDKHGPEMGSSSEGASKAECEVKEDGPQEEQETKQKVTEVTVTPTKKKAPSKPENQGRKESCGREGFVLEPPHKETQD